MEFSASYGTVFTRREHHEESIGCHRMCRQCPLGEVQRVVGEVPAGDVDRAALRVPQFDPVGSIAVGIEQRRVVRGHELVDEDVIQSRKIGHAAAIIGV